MDGLSLIDVSSEDDCLLFSSSLDPSITFSETDMDDKFLGFSDNVPDCDKEIPVSSLQEDEQALEPHESPEPEKMTKGWKCNLRKSLAWDNAFFTSAGVLEPEELSSIIESNQNGEKQMLSTIQEDIHRSTESICTLQSDCTAGDCHEPVLFQDVRASIQISYKGSDAMVPIDSLESEAAEAATIKSSSKLDGVSHGNMKHKPSPEKPSIGARGLGKTVKQNSLHPPVIQPGPTKGSLSEFTSKLHKGVSRVGPMSTTLTKRVNLDVNRAKLEKDAKSARGEGKGCPAADKGGPATKRPILGNSTTHILPKPVPPSRSSLSSSAAIENELTSSCSSLESCVSASSGSAHKSNLNRIKKKNDSSSKPAKPSSFTDVWATQSEGLKRASRGNGGVIQPASVKPTGLRMPSPKIGFFDGVRTVARAPAGNIQPRSGVTKGMPSGSSSSASSVKLQSSRSTFQDSSNLKTKATNVSSSPSTVSVSSPKVQKRGSSKNSGRKQLKAESDNEVEINDKVSPGSKITALAKDTALDNRKPETPVDRYPASCDEKAIPSVKVDEEGNKTDKVVEDQIDKSIEQVGGVDSNMKGEVGKDLTAENISLSNEQNAVVEVDGVSGKQMPPTVNNSSQHEDGKVGVQVSSEPGGYN